MTNEILICSPEEVSEFCCGAESDSCVPMCLADPDPTSTVVVSGINGLPCGRQGDEAKFQSDIGTIIEGNPTILICGQMACGSIHHAKGEGGTVGTPKIVASTVVMSPATAQAPSLMASDENPLAVLMDPNRRSVCEADRVEIHSRRAFGLRGASHTWTVVYKDGKKTTITGTTDSTLGALLIQENAPQDYFHLSAWFAEIPAPPGMTASEHASRVLSAGENAIWNSGAMDYAPLTPNGILEGQGNCHSVTTTVNADAGAPVPKGVDPPGQVNPGLGRQ